MAVAGNDLAAYRLRGLISQLRLSRTEAAALLRSIADEFEPTTVDEHLRAAAEREATSLRSEGITVTTSLDVRTLGAARVLGRRPKTLRNWRACGTGPPWRAESGIVRYSLLEVVAWQRGELSRSVPIPESSDV